MPKKNPELEKYASTLAQSAEKILRETNVTADGYQEKPPQSRTKAIIDFEGKLRSAGLDLFNGATYISMLSFYMSAKARESHDACGTLVQYLKFADSEPFLKGIGYREADEEDEPKMMAICGKFCQKVAKEFLGDLSRQGFPEMISSEPDNYLNSSPVGIDFPKDQYDQVEITFTTKGKKALIYELTMMVLPKK